jgi:hypothetical protein
MDIVGAFFYFTALKMTKLYSFYRFGVIPLFYSILFRSKAIDHGLSAIDQFTPCIIPILTLNLRQSNNTLN